METPEVHAPHAAHGTGVRWVDIALGGSAMLVSIISLFVAISHGRVMEKLVEENHRQVQASTWPFIALDLQTSYKGTAGVDAPSSIVASVSNHGNGPAKLQTIEVLLDGKPMASLAQLLRACCVTPDVKKARFNISSGQIDGSVLAQRETVNLLSLQPENPAAATMAKALVAAAPRLEIKSCYCSVFDECWYAKQGLPPRAVKGCPTNIVNFRG
jgi:hypothetical protein